MGRLDNGFVNDHNRNSLDSLVAGNARLGWQLNQYIASPCHNVDTDQDNPRARIIKDHNSYSLDPLVVGNDWFNWQLNPSIAGHCHNLDTDQDNPGARTIIAL